MPRRDHIRRPGNLEGASAAETSPTVAQVLPFENVPLGSRGSRRAVARWSDGTECEALAWDADLCGHPHESAYAQTRVIPTDPRDHGGSRSELETRHNSRTAWSPIPPGDCRALIAEAGLPLAPAPALVPCRCEPHLVMRCRNAREGERRYSNASHALAEGRHRNWTEPWSAPAAESVRTARMPAGQR